MPTRFSDEFCLPTDLWRFCQLASGSMTTFFQSCTLNGLWLNRDLYRKGRAPAFLGIDEDLTAVFFNNNIMSHG